MFRHFIIVLGIFAAPRCSAGWGSSFWSYLFPKPKTGPSLPPEALDHPLPQPLNQESLAKSGVFEFCVSVEKDPVLLGGFTGLAVKEELPFEALRTKMDTFMTAHLQEALGKEWFNLETFEDIKSVALEHFLKTWKQDVNLLNPGAGVPAGEKYETLWSTKVEKDSKIIEEYIGYGLVTDKTPMYVASVKKELIELSISGYTPSWQSWNQDSDEES